MSTADAITVDVDELLAAARDALKTRVADLTERETALRNELDEVIGARTIATGRLTDLDTILGPPPKPAHTTVQRPVKPAKTRANAARPLAPAARAKSEEARARWTPVFDWVSASKADGTYSLAGLTARFGTWAKNWAAAAKKFGVIITTPTPSPAGTAPADQAATSVTPAPSVPTSGARPGELHLECVDCPATFASTAAARLNSHCRLFHGRSSTATERTPIPAG